MISISMISFLFGAALGQRFNVVVLIPAMAIVLVLAVGAGRCTSSQLVDRGDGRDRIGMPAMRLFC